MITPEQIKAARALLKWKQSDLALAARISLPSVNNVERAIGSPRVDTLNAIKSACEDAGVEFLSHKGVQLREEAFEIIQHEGLDFIEKQNDDLFSCMKSADDDVMMCNLDERNFPKYAPDQVARYDAYQKKTKFKERILVKEGDTFFLAKPAVYRWIAPELMGKVAYLVYKNRFIMIMWKEKRVIIIKNQAIADTFKQQFEFLWRLAKAVPKNARSQLD
jgi:transcriptional regulator with XRE-family HTH domain